MDPLLKTIDPAPAFAPQVAQARPDRLIAGTPEFRTWAQDTARENVRTGVWQATPGETRSIKGETRLIKGETLEVCHILSGVVENTPEGGTPVHYGAGDCFVLKPGFVGVWKTIETVRKIYVIVGEAFALPTAGTTADSAAPRPDTEHAAARGPLACPQL